MKRKTFRYGIAVFAVLLIGLFALVGCKDEPPAEPPAPAEPLATITGVTFEDDTVLYDGAEHALQVSGTLPAGVSVQYGGEYTATAAGTYNATATLSGPGHETLVLEATLKITSAEKERAVFADGDTVYFANALDGEKLYKYANGAVTKISADVPRDFVKMGNGIYFHSGALFTSRIKSIGETGTNAVAAQKGEYLCTDGSALYFASNALKAADSGIYKLTLGGAEPEVTKLSAGKAEYLQYYGGKLYFADGENDGKLGCISVSGNGTRTNVVDEKITCLTQQNGVLYFTVNKLLGNYIARYTVSSGVVRKLTSDAGVNLTVIGGNLYYINADLLGSYINGKGIYRVSADPAADNNRAGTKVIGEDNETYSSLTAAGDRLAYYRTSDQMLCLSDVDGTNTVEVLDGFTAPESVPFSTGSKVAVYNNMLYFMDLYNDKALYSYNLHTKALARITANKVSDFSVIGDELYFNEVSYGVNNDLHKVNLRTGGEPEFVSSFDANDTVSDGTHIYYVEKNAAGARTAIRKAGDGDPVVYDKGAENLTYYKGYLYFLDGKKILRISVTDPAYNAETVKDGNCGMFVIADDVIYFREMYGFAGTSKRLSRMEIDGGQYAPMMTEKTDPLYIQTVGDTVYYYSDILSDNGSGIYSISQNANEDETPTLILARKQGEKSYYAEQFTVANGKIYFINYYNNLGDSHLYSVDIATGALEKLA